VQNGQGFDVGHLQKKGREEMVKQRAKDPVEPKAKKRVTGNSRGTKE